jgi:hypothetical protein
MSETGRTLLLICVLIAVYIVTRKVHAWRIKRTYILIIKDLEREEAFDPVSAVELPYVRASLFRVGIRDYLPKSLEYLVASHVVGMTDNRKYFLNKR